MQLTFFPPLFLFFSLTCLLTYPSQNHFQHSCFFVLFCGPLILCRIICMSRIWNHPLESGGSPFKTHKKTMTFLACPGSNPSVTNILVWRVRNLWSIMGYWQAHSCRPGAHNLHLCLLWNHICSGCVTPSKQHFTAFVPIL